MTRREDLMAMITSRLNPEQQTRLRRSAPFCWPGPIVDSEEVIVGAIINKYERKGGHVARLPHTHGRPTANTETDAEVRLTIGQQKAATIEQIVDLTGLAHETVSKSIRRLAVKGQIVNSRHAQPMVVPFTWSIGDPDAAARIVARKAEAKQVARRRRLALAASQRKRRKTA